MVLRVLVENLHKKHTGYFYAFYKKQQVYFFLMRKQRCLFNGNEFVFEKSSR